MNKRYDSGFTLIELMIVSAIIGLLAAIALPKFANMIIRAKEASVKGKLGAVRGALMIYYADTEGIFPGNAIGLIPPVSSPLVPKYINDIPILEIPTIPSHRPGNASVGSDVINEFFDLGYNSLAYYYHNGILSVNCSHVDSTGRIWSTW